jgi:glycosyltransferase involved in cell wall biosynthesis
MIERGLNATPFTRWAAKRTNLIVAISDYVARVVTTTDPTLRARMVTVRNGVDVAYFAPDESAQPFANDRDRQFVVSCRLEPWKQVHLAIEALAHAPGARDDSPQPDHTATRVIESGCRTVLQSHTDS